MGRQANFLGETLAYKRIGQLQTWYIEASILSGLILENNGMCAL